MATKPRKSHRVSELYAPQRWMAARISEEFATLLARLNLSMPAGWQPAGPASFSPMENTIEGSGKKYVELIATQPIERI